MNKVDNRESQRDKIAEGKIMKIVFVITDGGSSEARDAKNKIKELTDSGALVFAFQIGSVSKDEEKTFDQVWNESADGVKRGYKVGTEFYNLPAIIAEMLVAI